MVLFIYIKKQGIYVYTKITNEKIKTKSLTCNIGILEHYDARQSTRLNNYDIRKNWRIIPSMGIDKRRP
jgi:hypothetical protein